MTDDYPAHPLAAEYPLMGPAELEALADDIAANGQILPVVLWRGQVIDGRNRQAACRLRGTPCRYEEHLGSEEALPAHIASLNEHRRHLDAAFLRSRRAGRVARVAEARREGASLRQIAEAEKVSPTQVRKDVQAATVQGCTVAPKDGTVDGKDGKRRPAARKPKPPTVQGCTVDANGRPLPDGLKDVFADPALAAAEALIRSWAEALHPPTVVRPLTARLAAYPYLLIASLADDLRQAEAALASALEKVRNARPHAVCPHCDGAGCDDCRHCGYLPAWAVAGVAS